MGFSLTSHPCFEEDIAGDLILYGEVIEVETRTVLYIVDIVVRLLPFVGF